MDDVHPLAWWAWAVALAAGATRNPSAAVLGALLLAGTAVVGLRRGAAGLRALRTFLVLGAVVVGLRLVFHVLVGIKVPGTPVLDLPVVRLPEWAPGIQVLGPVTAEGAARALAGGLQLAVLVVLLGAGTVLADPRRVLRVVPAALHQMATAVVVAVGVTPRLATSAQEVRRAQRLRGDGGPPRHLVRRLVVPVLSDALDQAVALASSMESRGYARSLGRPDARVLPLLSVAVVAATVAVYTALDGRSPALVPVLSTAVALLSGVLGARLAGRRTHRTRYVEERWGVVETLIAGAALLAAVLVAVASSAPASSALLSLGGQAAVLAVVLTLAVAPAQLGPLVVLRARPAYHQDAAGVAA